MSQRPADPLNQPMTGRACLTGCALWALVMSLPVLMVVLAMQGELGWQRGPANLEEDRLVFISEPEAQGLAYFASRLAPGPADQTCINTTVSYLLWRNAEGGNPNAAYCQCYQVQANTATPLGPCP